MSRKATSPRPQRIHGNRRGRGDEVQGQKSKEPQDWYHYCLYNCGYFLWPVCKSVFSFYVPTTKSPMSELSTILIILCHLPPDFLNLKKNTTSDRLNHFG